MCFLAPLCALAEGWRSRQQTPLQGHSHFAKPPCGRSLPAPHPALGPNLVSVHSRSLGAVDRPLWMNTPVPTGSCGSPSWVVGVSAPALRLQRSEQGLGLERGTQPSPTLWRWPELNG